MQQMVPGVGPNGEQVLVPFNAAAAGVAVVGQPGVVGQEVTTGPEAV